MVEIVNFTTLNNNNYAVNVNKFADKVSFKSTPVNNFERIPDKDRLITSTKENKNNVGKLLFVTVMIGLGLEVFAGKGKHLKDIWNKFKPSPMNNLTDLGVKLEDGTIRFKTEEQALQYAKEQVVKYLRCDPEKQIEVAVAVRGCDVLGMNKGGKHCVAIHTINGIKPRTTNIESNITLVHGHPDYGKKGNAKPISLEDISLLSTYNLKSIIACNSLSETNSITIKNLNKFNYSNIGKIWHLHDLYICEKKLSTAEYQEYYNLEKSINSLRAQRKTVPEEIQNRYYELQNKAKSLCPESSNEIIQVRHEAYKKYCADADLIYTTNFSYLK